VVLPFSYTHKKKKKKKMPIKVTQKWIQIRGGGVGGLAPSLNHKKTWQRPGLPGVLLQNCAHT